jgi:hypothetical protein
MPLTEPVKLPAPSGLPPEGRWIAMLPVLIAVALATIDAAIANTALPTIASDLHTSAVDSIWVVNAYQLAYVVALLPFASLGEIFGYRRVYIAGLALDFCVRWSAEDARHLDCEAVVIADACRAIDTGGSLDAARLAFQQSNVEVIQSASIL